MRPRDGHGLTLDVLAVVVFVTIGRLQHDAASAFTVTGFLETLWPFVAGLGIAVLVATLAHGMYRSVLTGAGIALVTAVSGLALRFASGQGLAASFAIVTAVVLGVLMLGWRLAAARLT